MLTCWKHNGKKGDLIDNNGNIIESNVKAEDFPVRAKYHEDLAQKNIQIFHLRKLWQSIWMN